MVKQSPNTNAVPTDVVRKTPTGLIIERPTSALKIEKAMYGKSDYHFSFNSRTWDNVAEYDQRYVGKYRYPYAFIGGWWASYYGFMPHPFPMDLKADNPFHIPWVVTDEFEGLCSQAQRKPIPGAAASNIWWAIEMSTCSEPTLEVPDLTLAVPSKPLGEKWRDKPFVRPPPPLADVYVDLWRDISQVCKDLLTLPLPVLAGLSNRTSPESIMAWAWHAALWADDNPEGLPNDWAMLAYDYKANYMLLNEKTPTTMTGVEKNYPIFKNKDDE